MAFAGLKKPQERAGNKLPLSSSFNQIVVDVIEYLKKSTAA